MLIYATGFSFRVLDYGTPIKGITNLIGNIILTKQRKSSERNSKRILSILGMNLEERVDKGKDNQEGVAAYGCQFESAQR